MSDPPLLRGAQAFTGHLRSLRRRFRLIALGYSRRSKEATERTVSFEDWQARIAAYAAERGWQLIEVLVDDGVSGCSVSQSAAGRRGPGS